MANVFRPPEARLAMNQALLPQLNRGLNSGPAPCTVLSRLSPQSQPQALQAGPTPRHWLNQPLPAGTFCCSPHLGCSLLPTRALWKRRLQLRKALEACGPWALAALEAWHRRCWRVGESAFSSSRRPPSLTVWKAL